MSTITINKSHKYPWYVRLFFWNQKRRYGAILEPAKLWGTSPKVFSSLALLYGALDRKSSPLDPALRTLITVRVSQINWCAFCVDINSATGIQRDIHIAKLEALPRFIDSGMFSDQEKAALCFAESITYTNRSTTDDELKELRKYFDDTAIIELAGLIAFQNMSSKFNSALSVEPQGFCMQIESDPDELRRVSDV